MTTAFWQQDSDRVILTFLGPPGLTNSDVDALATQNSLRAGLLSSGISVCDGSLYSQVKSNTAYFGIKSYPYGSTTVVIVLEKAHSGEQWPSLFAEGAAENGRIFPVICTVKAFSEYAATDPSELTFPNEAVITVIYQDPSGWWNGFYEGNLGSLPSNFVSVLPEQAIVLDFDDPNNITYIGRGGAGGGGAGPVGGIGMPGMGRGMGFGANLSGELGTALKRRTQNLQQGISNENTAPAPHRPAPPPAAVMQQQQQQQADFERQRQEQEAAAAAAAAAEAAAEAERQRKAEEEAAAEAERQRKAAEADALAQELARKQMEAMQAQAAAVASIPTVNNLVPGVTTVKATSAYEGSEGELSFGEGELIKVWQIDPSGWWEGECRGVKGWFPSNFVVLVPTPQEKPAPVAPASSSSSSKTHSSKPSSGNVLDQAIQSNKAAPTLRHNARAKGPSKRAPTAHAAPKIQTWDSTEQSPEAGAAAAAAAAESSSSSGPAVHRPPIGAVGIFPMPSRGGLPPRGGRGGGVGGRGMPLPSRGGMAGRGGGGAAPPPPPAASRGGRGGSLPARGGPGFVGRGRQSIRVDTPAESHAPQPSKPLVIPRKAPAPPRPEVPAAVALAAATAASSPPAPAVPAAAPAPVPAPAVPAAAPVVPHPTVVPSSTSGSSFVPSSIVTDPARMTPPKSWGLPVPVADFCAAAAKLMKSLPAPSSNVISSPNLPEVEGMNLNARALAVCTSEGQVFVAGEKAACSAQGAVWPLLQALLPLNVTRSLYANQPSDDTKVASSAQNGCSISGAVAACSVMIDQHPNEEVWDRLAHFSASCSSICGSNVGFDLAAYSKTKKHSDAAWGTAYAMKGAGSFANNVSDVMELFFQLSSVQLTLPAAARLAAALADCLNCSVGLPSREEAVNHMKNFGLVKDVPVFGGESGLAIAIAPKVGGIAFWCPAVSSTSHIPIVSREFFKQLFDKYPL